MDCVAQRSDHLTTASFSISRIPRLTTTSIQTHGIFTCRIIVTAVGACLTLVKVWNNSDKNSHSHLLMQAKKYCREGETYSYHELDNTAKNIFGKVSSTFHYTQEHRNTVKNIVNCGAFTMPKHL